MDTRLTELLPAALGLKNGDTKIIKNAGGLVISPFDSAMRSLLVAIYELGVEEIMVIAECTNPSLGVGYELAYAESHGISCHIFYDKSKTELSAMLTGNPYFQIHPYQNEKDLFDKIDNILLKKI